MYLKKNIDINNVLAIINLNKKKMKRNQEINKKV